MKKIILALCSGIIIQTSVFAQPVSDRAVIPVAVTLNQILRIHVTNGGNIEFVFNTIAQFQNGIANSAFYDTDVVVAASSNWELFFGAEDANLMPTDEIGGSTIALSWVEFMVTNNGTNSILAVAGGNSIINNNALTIRNGLGQFAVTASQNPMITAAALNNGGDIADNAFSINWSCGTNPSVGAGTVLTQADVLNVGLLGANIRPDRYVTNVLLELQDL